MNLNEFVLWLASAGALGVVASFLFQALKAVFPSLKDQWATIGSVVFAAILNVAAQQMIPLLPSVPAWAQQLWPVITWLWSQIVYQFIKPQPE